MRYPLRLVKVVEQTHRYAVADANHRVVIQIMDVERAYDLAVFIVRAANRWRKVRLYFKPYNRDDWLKDRDFA
jgi:UV DNA damage repair endonuclease